MDVYSVDYPNVGETDDGQPLNHFRIVAVPNTKDIITMYPCEDYFLPRKKQLTRT